MVSHHMVESLGAGIRDQICRKNGAQDPKVALVDAVLSRLKDRVNGDPEVCEAELMRIGADAGVFRQLGHVEHDYR